MYIHYFLIRKQRKLAAKQQSNKKRELKVCKNTPLRPRINLTCGIWCSMQWKQQEN